MDPNDVLDALAVDVEAEKQWAIGLSQVEFHQQWCRRFPWSMDCIPDVEKWLKRKTPVGRGMTPIAPEEYADDLNSIKERQKENEKNKEKPAPLCRGCGFEAKSDFGLQSHERRCAAALNLKK